MSLPAAVNSSVANAEHQASGLQIRMNESPVNQNSAKTKCDLSIFGTGYLCCIK